jgi:hypothetical protein
LFFACGGATAEAEDSDAYGGRGRADVEDAADVYLFFNEGAEASSPTMTLRSEGRRAEIWDPQTGKIAAAKATSAKGAVKLQLELKPYETRVVVVVR